MNGGFPIREAVKKRVFYGQADRKGLNSPLYGQFFVIFFQGVHLTLDYDNMYSEMEFTPEGQGKRMRTKGSHPAPIVQFF